MKDMNLSALVHSDAFPSVVACKTAQWNGTTPICGKIGNSFKSVWARINAVCLTTASQSFRQPVCRYISHSVRPSLGQSVLKSTSQSLSRSVARSLSRSAGRRSIGPSVRRSSVVGQRSGVSGQWVSESANQRVSESVKQWVSRSVDQLVSRSASQWVSWSAVGGSVSQRHWYCLICVEFLFLLCFFPNF